MILITLLIPAWTPSHVKNALSFQALKHVKQLLCVLHLVGSWQVLHNRDTDFSYYSKTFDTYSHLHLLFIDQFYLSNGISSTIESVTISDHSPVTLCFCPLTVHETERTWILNETLLTDLTVVKTLSWSLQFYFETNSSGNVSMQAIWEGHKSVIRREMIAHGSCIKKTERNHIL